MLIWFPPAPGVYETYEIILPCTLGCFQGDLSTIAKHILEEYVIHVPSGFNLIHVVGLPI